VQAFPWQQEGDRLMKARLLVLAVLMVTPGPTGADARLAVEAPTVMLVPGHLVVETFVEPDALNKSIQVTTESPNFYRSSEAPLDGSTAPRRNTFEFKDLPTGTYEIRALLLDAKGDHLADVVRSLNVISHARHR
jgi:hypothetical protein